MRVPIPRKAVWKQLKADLIGKDSYRGVTLTYAWLANQLGHLALGFIPTIVLFIYLSRQMEKTKAALWSAVIIASVWTLFEAYNFLGPLLLKKRSASRTVFVPKARYTFTPAWRNIAFDTLTDVIFFCFGAFTASICCVYSDNAAVVLVVLLLALIYPCAYWYLTKMYLQAPQYPFQFRLSQWEKDISEQNKTSVERFMQNEGSGMHLLLFGHRGSGKTTLSVGIATEMSIRRHSAIYVTAMKLYCLFFEPHSEDEEALWNWRNSSVLIIDDINPGGPIPKDIVAPGFFLEMLDTFKENEINRKALKSKNVIWVLGNSVPAQNVLDTWESMLQRIGVNKECILTVNLSV